MYIDDTEALALTSSYIRFGNTADTAYYQLAASVWGTLADGWNKVHVLKSAFSSSGAPNWNSIAKLTFVINRLGESPSSTASSTASSTPSSTVSATVSATPSVRERLKFDFKECSVLVLGAGGAVRGVIGALLDVSPRWIAVSNRTHQRAEELAEEFGVEAIHLDEVPAEHFDLIVNGTTTGLKHDAPPIDPETFNDCTLAYDLVYAADSTPFMELAPSGGAKIVSDGLGMLIEQPAVSFLLWRGVRPETAPVYRDMRKLNSEAAAESTTVVR